MNSSSSEPCQLAPRTGCSAGQKCIKIKFKEGLNKFTKNHQGPEHSCGLGSPSAQLGAKHSTQLDGRPGLLRNNTKFSPHHLLHELINYQKSSQDRRQRASLNPTLHSGIAEHYNPAPSSTQLLSAQHEMVPSSTIAHGHSPNKLGQANARHAPVRLTELDVPILREEHVACLQVTVDDLFAVEVMEGFQHLAANHLDLGFSQAPVQLCGEGESL